MTVLFRSDPPRVTAVGVTKPIDGAFDSYLGSRDILWYSDAHDTPEALAEFGGRLCYGAKSFKNPRNTAQGDYLYDSIIKHKHESVIEHVVVNFAVEGLARDILLELERHRHISLSVRSTRFTDDYMEFLIPPYIRESEYLTEEYKEACLDAVDKYDLFCDTIDTSGLPDTLAKKRKKEASRHILPGGLTADLLMTVNARALRHIIQLRTEEGADLAFREFGYNLYKCAEGVIPALMVGAKVRHVGGAYEVRFSD